jgi:hypothetical protein
MTYTQLQTAVQDYVENSFSATDFATMVRLAEQKIFNATQAPITRKNSVIPLVIGTSTVNLPTDFLSAFSVAVVLATGDWEYLLNKDVNFLRSAYPDPTDTGTPRYYALYGTQGNPLVQTLELAPTPGATLNLQVAYNAYPESITTAVSGRSWLGDNYESVLFNGVLVETARFMKQEPDIIAMYDKEFQQSLALVKMLFDGKNRQDSYRSGQPKTQVV